MYTPGLLANRPVLVAGTLPFLNPEADRAIDRAVEAARPAPTAAVLLRGALGLGRRVGLVIWRTLERAGQRRAARELPLLADRLAHSHPEAAADLRAFIAQWRQA